MRIEEIFLNEEEYKQLLEDVAQRNLSKKLTEDPNLKESSQQSKKDKFKK